VYPLEDITVKYSLGDFLLGLVIGYLIATTLNSRQKNVIFNRDSSGRIIGIYYV